MHLYYLIYFNILFYILCCCVFLWVMSLQSIQWHLLKSSYFCKCLVALLRRPVSDSPTIFSLTCSQISLALLAEREKWVLTLYPGSSSPSPLKKDPAYRMQAPSCVIAHANRTQRCNKAVYLLLCLLQFSTKQNIPLFLQYQTSGIAVNRWRIVSDGNPLNCFFFRDGTLDMRMVMRVLRVYPTPSPPTRGLCEHRKLPRWGLGWSHSRKRFLDVLCYFTRVCSMQVLSLEGSKSSLQRQRVTQKQSMFVECWCW